VITRRVLFRVSGHGNGTYRCPHSCGETPGKKSYKLYPTLGRFGVIADNPINIGHVLAESTDP
jgi:hypothetical protein